MADKLTRRHLFARLGALLAGLWACRPGRAPAAPAPVPPAAAHSPEGTTVTTCTYDCDGRLLRVEDGSPR
jgi:hypothetical protein